MIKLLFLYYIITFYQNKTLYSETPISQNQNDFLSKEKFCIGSDSSDSHSVKFKIFPQYICICH